MNLRFINWYTQALGATFGVIACVYACLNGFISTYSNINAHFDNLWFGGILSSYLLLPLCCITLVLAVVKSFLSNERIFNSNFQTYNTGIIIATVIIGFMGAKIYFTIPSIFILFNVLNEYRYTQKTNALNEVKQQEINSNIYTDISINTVDLQNYNLESTIIANDLKKSSNTKIEMAKELLSKNAEKQFIIEITGLTTTQLEEIEEEFAKTVEN